MASSSSVEELKEFSKDELQKIIEDLGLRIGSSIMNMTIGLCIEVRTNQRHNPNLNPRDLIPATTAITSTLTPLVGIPSLVPTTTGSLVNKSAKYIFDKKHRKGKAKKVKAVFDSRQRYEQQNHFENILKIISHATTEILYIFETQVHRIAADMNFSNNFDKLATDITARIMNYFSTKKEKECLILTLSPSILVKALLEGTSTGKWKENPLILKLKPGKTLEMHSTEEKWYTKEMFENVGLQVEYLDNGKREVYILKEDDMHVKYGFRRQAEFETMNGLSTKLKEKYSRKNEFPFILDKCMIGPVKDAVFKKLKINYKTTGSVQSDSLTCAEEASCDSDSEIENALPSLVLECAEESETESDSKQLDKSIPDVQRFKGHVLIINNICYEDLCHRHGNEQNGKELQQLFKSLGFSPPMYIENKQSQDVMEAVINFKSRFGTESTQENICCIIYIMSYGEGDRITLCNGEQVNIWEDIVRPFRDLRGIPKIFVFDCNTDILQLPKWHSDHHNGLPPIKNSLFCFASLPGMTQFKSRVTGSYFSTSFVKVLEKYAKTKGLLAMLDKVREDLANLEVDFGSKYIPSQGDSITQIPFWFPIHFNEIFFNPIDYPE